MSNEEFEYRIQYGGSFQKQVRDGNPNPLLGIKIIVNGNDLTGAPADREEYYTKDYMNYNLANILRQLPGLADGEQLQIKFYEQSRDLILSPTNDEVDIGFISGYKFEEGKTPEYERTSKSGLITEFIQTAEEFRERIIQTNPDLDNHEEVTNLVEAIEEAKASLCH